MNSWFTQLNALIALREAGNLSEEAFEDQKKRLWHLEQSLAELGKLIDAAAKEHAHNERFQMRLMEIQLEPDGLDLVGREQWFAQLQDSFHAEMAHVESNEASAAGDELAETMTAISLSPDQAQRIERETEALVETLRTRLSTLRGERFDTDIWSLADKIDDAIYRNGSEPVEHWRDRVLKQAEHLSTLENS